MTKIEDKINDRINTISESKTLISEIIKTITPLIIKELTKTTNTKDLSIDILKCIVKEDIKEIRECIVTVINQYELEKP